ncbi:MAG: hypothetical protein Fur0037_16390 [Planctomycetota bacterium]
MTRSRSLWFVVSTLWFSASAPPQRPHAGDPGALAGGGGGFSSPIRLQDEPASRTHFRMGLMLAGGGFEHDTEGSSLADETGGAYFRLAFEGVSDAGFGGGVRLEGAASDDNLFEGTGFPASQATDGELFAFGSYCMRARRFEMPIRAGFFFKDYSLEEQVSGGTVDWTAFGGRVEVEPEVFLIEGEGFRWGLYTRLSGGGGSGQVDTDPTTIGEADTDMSVFDAEIGTRWRLRHVDFGFGFLYRRASWDQSDPVGPNFYRQADEEFSGFLLSIAARF